MTIFWKSFFFYLKFFYFSLGSSFLSHFFFKLTMTFLAAIHRMAPAAVKQAATASMKPTAIALTQKRFKSSGTEV